MNPLNSIRNFSIIAHIDHGKTTLTDRFLERTGTVAKRLMHERFLDSHPIAQKRGVTIKLAPVRMNYKNYIFNLIDTPGHIDFSYEVSRSLACCEGAILLVDASQGIQAQTLVNYQLAKKLGLKIIPVVNKIDLYNAQVEKTAAELCQNFNFKKDEVIFVSAKDDENVNQVLEEVIKKIPPPQGQKEKPLKALVFDSFYDSHKGVIVYLRIFDGFLDLNQKTPPILQFLASKLKFEPLEIGFLTPKMTPVDKIGPGEVGYLATGLKEISHSHVGDTLTSLKTKNEKIGVKPLLGYQEPKPVVFFDFYPVENKDYIILDDSLKQLKLNDFSLGFNPVSSPALGKGFRLGFLGIFHALITQEKLEEDFNLSIVITSPSVEYWIVKKDSSLLKIHSASEIDDLSQIKEVREPWITASIFTPIKYLGPVFELCQNKRGRFVNQEYFGDYINLKYELPLIELVGGFYDQLKSVSSGFASFNYQLADFRPFKAVKLDVLIQRVKVEVLSMIVNKEKGEKVAKKLAKKLKEVIPKQLFEVPIQISLNGKIIARETVKAYRKDVTAKLYGGDQTRKDKLLKKQKKGKKRMKQIGRINLPQEAFMAVLEIEK
ncbi:elongation factor 4 [Candidatus Beckwithbacteria bacterium CG10_big_fil_rev_8_21_14_0_10_34_10]|uniref:Elongation factor 4 n=1 Tax=Candidatus Beckwithbacteria bacterium CG10_big_fil_rev_8_21_14_0_10_34_10 TaxID=1974495 RepID=A0A2H0W9H9_9BACT|nr:MAG: elongation factor 4 [Candidatus Beckwithbacteria bacterium CG10_big_fil_rev_8_21_14_0_10_34_10]